MKSVILEVTCFKSAKVHDGWKQTLKVNLHRTNSFCQKIISVSINPRKKTFDRWKNFDENVGSNINDIVVITTDGNLVDQYKGHSFDLKQHEHLFSTPSKKGVNP